MSYPIAAVRNKNFGVLDYWAKIKGVFGLSVIGYWPLYENSGVTAYDISGNNRNGTFRNDDGTPPVLQGITLSNTVGPKNKKVPLFDGSAGYCNIYSSGLSNAFNGSEGTFMIWAKVSSATVWADATVRYLANIFFNTSTNTIHFIKSSVNSTMTLRYRAGSVTRDFNITDSPTGWMHYCLTWSSSGNATNAYINSVAQTPQAVGTWSGVPGTMLIGAGTATPTNFYSGWLADAILLNKAATPTEISKVYNLN